MQFNNLKSKKTIYISIACILALLMVSAIARNIIKNKKTESTNNTKNVKVIEAKISSLSTNVDYSGKLSSGKNISISPQSPGKIESVNVKVGSTVKSGDILFTINSDNLKAQLNQQQAGVDSAKANLNKTQSSGIDQQVVQAQQNVKTSQIAYNDAYSNYTKTQKLYSAGAAAKQELDAAKTKLDTASATLSAAKENLSLIQTKIGPESVAAAEAQVSQAEAGVEAVQTQIDQNTIKSPISGIVSAVNINTGEMSPTGQPSITLLDYSDMIAETSIPDMMLSKIKVGQSIPIDVPSFPNKKLKGTVESISPDADSKTQEYVIKINVQNDGNQLKPGMFCKISFPYESKSNIIVVPNQAIKIENGVSYLYTVNNNKIKKIAVTTGISNDTYTEIKSNNINPGDIIVPEGQTFLNNGDKVKIID